MPPIMPPEVFPGLGFPPSKLNKMSGEISKSLLMPSETGLGGLNGEGQNNMFHFGDVSVSHHPDSPPVPMVIPMVYLYPLPAHKESGNTLENSHFV